VAGGFDKKSSVLSETLFTKLKEIIDSNEIGDMVSIDLNWYLNTYNGASYFRRWHGLREKGGTLLLHKSAYHFDLLNWFIGSDPIETYAYGASSITEKAIPLEAKIVEHATIRRHVNSIGISQKMRLTWTCMLPTRNMMAT
jgi:predicted dehydrogenase